MEKKKPILSLYLTKQHLEDTVRQPRSEVFIFVFSRESFYLITVMTRVFSHCMVAQTCEFILRQLQPSVVWAHTHTHTLRISLSMKDNIFPHHQQEINGELSFFIKGEGFVITMQLLFQVMLREHGDRNSCTSISDKCCNISFCTSPWLHDTVRRLPT